MLNPAEIVVFVMVAFLVQQAYGIGRIKSACPYCNRSWKRHRDDCYMKD